MFIPYVICPVRFINDKRAAKIQQSGAKIRTGTVPHIFNGTYVKTVFFSLQLFFVKRSAIIFVYYYTQWI